MRYTSPLFHLEKPPSTDNDSSPFWSFEVRHNAGSNVDSKDVLLNNIEDRESFPLTPRITHFPSSKYDFSQADDPNPSSPKCASGIFPFDSMNSEAKLRPKTYLSYSHSSDDSKFEQPIVSFGSDKSRDDFEARCKKKKVRLVRLF